MIVEGLDPAIVATMLELNIMHPTAGDQKKRIIIIFIIIIIMSIMRI